MNVVAEMVRGDLVTKKAMRPFKLPTPIARPMPTIAARVRIETRTHFDSLVREFRLVPPDAREVVSGFSGAFGFSFGSFGIGERPHSSSRRNRATIGKRLLGDFYAVRPT